MLKIMEKKTYTPPLIQKVLLDNEISILLVSPKSEDLGTGGPPGTQGGTDDQEPYNPFINPFKWFR